MNNQKNCVIKNRKAKKTATKGDADWMMDQLALERIVMVSQGDITSADAAIKGKKYDLRSEDRISFAAIAKYLAVESSTIANWADHGYRGIGMEHFRIGNRRYSTDQAMGRFLAAVKQRIFG